MNNFDEDHNEYAPIPLEGNIFKAAGFVNSDVMLMRAELANAITTRIKTLNLTQQEAAKHLGTSQPNVSELMNAKIAKFTLETLIQYAAKLGLRTEVHCIAA